MKKFRFSLQAVLTVRTWRESQASQAFGRALQLRREAEETLGALQRQTSALAAAICADRGWPALQANYLAAYREQCAREQRGAEAVAAAAAAVEKNRTAWLAARRDLRALENLAQKARQRHRVAAEREEQRAQDERPASRLRPETSFVS